MMKIKRVLFEVAYLILLFAVSGVVGIYGWSIVGEFMGWK